MTRWCRSDRVTDIDIDNSGAGMSFGAPMKLIAQPVERFLSKERDFHLQAWFLIPGEILGRQFLCFIIEITEPRLIARIGRFKATPKPKELTVEANVTDNFTLRTPILRFTIAAIKTRLIREVCTLAKIQRQSRILETWYLLEKSIVLSRYLYYIPRS